MIPPHDSLVKYDNPILVSTTSTKVRGAGRTPGGRSRTAPLWRHQKSVLAHHFVLLYVTVPPQIVVLDSHL